MNKRVKIDLTRQIRAKISTPSFITGDLGPLIRSFLTDTRSLNCTSTDLSEYGRDEVLAERLALAQENSFSQKCYMYEPRSPKYEY